MIWYLYSKWHTGCKNFHAASTFIFWSIWNKKKNRVPQIHKQVQARSRTKHSFLELVCLDLFFVSCAVYCSLRPAAFRSCLPHSTRPYRVGLFNKRLHFAEKGYYLVHFTSLRYIKTVSDVGSGFHKSLKIFWESCQHSATLSSPMTIHNFTHNTPLSCHFRFTGKFPNLQSVGFVLNLSCCSILPCFTNLNVALYMAYLYWTEQ